MPFIFDQGLKVAAQGNPAGSLADGLAIGAQLGALKERLRIQAQQEGREQIQFGQEQQDRAEGREAMGAVGEARTMVQGQSNPLAIVEQMATQFKSPQAREIFLREAGPIAKQAIVQTKGEELKGKLQDRLVGVQRTPGAESFAEILGAMADELELLPELEIEQQAAMIDQHASRLAKIEPAIDEKLMRERTDMEAIAQLDAMIEAAPIGSQLRNMLQMMKIQVELTRTKGADLMRPMVQAAGIQQRGQAQEQNAAIKERGLDIREEQGKAGQETKAKELSERERHNKAMEQRPVGGRTVTGLKVPDFNAVARRAQQLFEAGIISGEEITQEEAFKRAQDEARRHWESSQEQLKSKLTPERRAVLKAEGYTDEQLDALGGG